MTRKIRRRWPMGAYAELIKPEFLPAQMVLKDVKYADLARGINAKHGVPGRPQVVSRQFLSRLGNGKVKGNRCSPFLAQCISAELSVELEMLFRLVGVSHDVALSAPARERQTA